MVDLDYVGLQIGHAGKLDRRHLKQAIQHALKLIRTLSPTTPIDLAIGGYDDDPRQIYEIPEARRYVLEFVEGLDKAGVTIERFLPVAVNFIRLCADVEAGKTVTVSGEPEIDIADQVEAYRKRVRRSMH
jgi:hypothetical protein